MQKTHNLRNYRKRLDEFSKMEIDSEQVSNDGSKESSEDSDENEEILEAQVSNLEKQISENVFQYQLHLDVIKALKELGDLDRLRNARNRMAEVFPLAPNLWMEWLQDEQKIATSIEEKKNLVPLFEKAVKDYLSVDIWLEYVQFNIGLHSEALEFDDIRNVFERSLTAAGLHVTKGSLLWEAFIEFEVMVLSLIQENSEEYENQLKKIANLFKRQLSCPLFGIDDTFSTFSTWLEDTVGSKSIIDKTMVENIYKKSKEKLTKIEPFENALLSDTENMANHYKEYLEHEKSKDGSPVRVQCLYERIVADFCLNDEFWLEYIDYVKQTLNNGIAAVEVTRRAIRNCPWSFRIYRSLIRTLEKYERPHQEITEAVEQALASGLQTAGDFREIWMTYLEYLRRRLDALDLTKEEEEKRLQDLTKVFSKAVEYLSQIENSDPDSSVVQFWARIEAIYCKNMEKSRSLWNDIVAVEGNKTWEMWMEYINLERIYGDSKHLRKLFPRALQNTKDWPEHIGKVWLNYERDEGTLDSYENCLNKVKSRSNQIREQREKEEKAKQMVIEKQPSVKARPKKAGLGYKEKNWTENHPEKKSITGYKRKQTNDVEAEEKAVDPSKKSKKEPENNEEFVKKLLDEEHKDHGVTVVHDHSKDDRTVFVSNLDFATEESAIREKFTDCGNITDLRLVKDYKGRSKGYCYVEFEKEKEAKKALTKDREPINGRPMFVSRCDPDKATRMPGFKFSSSLEKNKLFIRGLPYTTTSEDLRELFGRFGAVKDVRLVTYRNGHSKGLAYVDFEDEVSAAQAILKTDGTTIGDKEISVSISNPPDRKSETSGTKQVSSLGGGPKEFGPRGRSRTQISFLPRSLQLNQNSATNSMANLSIKSPSNQNKNLTNDDFKKLVP